MNTNFIQYQLLRRDEVLAQTGYSRSSIYRRIQQGLFPPPVTLSLRSVAWPSHEVDFIVKAIMSNKSKDEMRVLVSELIEQRGELLS